MATNIKVGETLWSSATSIRPLDGTNVSAYYIRQGFYLKSQDEAKQQSTVVCYVQMRSGGKYFYGAYTACKVYQATSTNGGSYSSYASSPAYPIGSSDGTEWHTFKTTTVTVQHTSDGKGSISTKAYFQPNYSLTSSNYYLPGNSSTNTTDTFVLPDLHRAPVINSVEITQELNPILSQSSVSLSPEKIVLGQSKKTIVYNITTYNSATIKSIKLGNYEFTPTQNGSLYTITVDFSQYNFASGTSLTLLTAVTDSKNAVASKSITWNNVVPYIRPSFNDAECSVKRNGQLSGQIKFTLSARFYNQPIAGQQGSIQPSYTIQYKYYQKGSSSSTWLTVPSSSITNTNGTLKVSNFVLRDSAGAVYGGFDKDNIYIIDMRITDQFGEATPFTKEVPRGQYLWAEFQDRVDFQKITQNNNPVVIKPELTKVGDVKITSTNVGKEEMAKRYGGTWELVDKEFKNVYEYVTGTNIASLTKLSALNVRLFRSGHTVVLDCDATISAAITETDMALCTLKVDVLGFTGQVGDRTMWFTGFSDTGNNMIQFKMSTANFIIYSLDAIGDDSHQISSGRAIYWGQTIVANSFTSMLDADCDKFYWKRIS